MSPITPPDDAAQTNRSDVTISVVIPVYNDPEGIEDTLRSVTEQTYDDYEVVPVDNNSSDHTPDVIEDWANRNPELVYPTTEEQIQSSYAARNEGIRHARGDIIAFIDADMTAPPDWLAKIERQFSQHDVDYLGYTVDIYVPEGEGSLWCWYDSSFGLPSQYYFHEHGYSPTACLAVRREVFDIVGPFRSDMTSGGDKEFGNRVFARRDLKTLFVEDIVVHHPARTTFLEHYSKWDRVSKGHVQRRESENRDTDASVRGRLSPLLPPRPSEVYRASRGVSLSTFPVLYAMVLVIQYIQLILSLKHLLLTRIRS